MKVSKILISAFISAAVLAGTVSCNSTDIANIAAAVAKTASSAIPTPTLAFKSIGIKSLDTEGITFDCSYDITNPYGVAVSLASVAADIKCNGSKLTSVSSSGGVNLAARTTQTNRFDFKLPYTSLVELAKNYKNASGNLPCSVSGSVGLDLSKVTALKNKSLSLPFSKNFDAPVVKPSFSLSSPKLVLPSVSEMVSAFTGGGMTAAKAAAVAAAIAAGSSIDSAVFNNVNLNMKLNFDLSVKNEGSSAWKYLLKSCAIRTGGSNLINLDTTGAAAITSSSGTVPLTATLNTITAGKFIAQIINKSGTNPEFSLQSGLSFPGTSFASDLPLNYTKTIPLNSFAITKK